MTADELRVRLKPMNLTHVARVTGANISTIWRFYHGEIKEPKLALFQRMVQLVETGE